MKPDIYTLTSELHNKEAVQAVTQEFLGSLGIDYTFKGSDFSDYAHSPLPLIYVCTGGTEGIFQKLLNAHPSPLNTPPSTLNSQPFYLLTSGKNNSLAASMEILSYLRQHNMNGEIIHGSAEYISQRIQLLAKVSEARQQFNGCRLGVIGKPSDWLISSEADYQQVKERLGIELIDIPMQELLDTIENLKSQTSNLKSYIYDALKMLIERYRLQGFTLRCFDLLNTVHDTGCMALAQLNSEGYVAGCEGDVPAMLSMMITRSVLGVSGFQANPSSMNPESGEILFAHCTIPLNMVERYELDTHFESGIGVAIRGYMKTGDVTIFKVSGDLSRHFIAEGQLLRNEAKPNLCRTQQVIQLDNPTLISSYFLTNPIGNHHIIMPGHQRQVLEEMLKMKD